MALIPCPACGRQISIAAEACPQCGHPNRPAPPAPVSKGPGCYCCSSSATTRCVACGTFSCPVHVQSIWVQHGKSGAYELRCESCYQSAAAWNTFRWVVLGIVLAVLLFGGMMAAIYSARH